MGRERERETEMNGDAANVSVDGTRAIEERDSKVNDVAQLSRCR